MAGSWIDNGPVSLPPRALAYTAGALVVALALVGAAIGFRAAWRQASAPQLGSDVVQGAGEGVLSAKPIVDAPPPAPAADAQADDTADAAADAKAQALAAQTAEAQAIQAKPSKEGGNIDEIMTSPAEKPPATVKAPTDEAPPPGAPVKSDVPF